MKLFPVFTALALAATPLAAQANELTTFEKAVIARALSICFVMEGRGTSQQVAQWELKALAKDGIAPRQVVTLSESHIYEQQVYKHISNNGGCTNWLKRLDNKPSVRPPATNDLQWNL